MFRHVPLVPVAGGVAGGVGDCVAAGVVGEGAVGDAGDEPPPQAVIKQAARPAIHNSQRFDPIVILPPGGLRLA
jgi:hypothetical protein